MQLRKSSEGQLCALIFILTGVGGAHVEGAEQAVGGGEAATGCWPVGGGDS